MVAGCPLLPPVVSLLHVGGDLDLSWARTGSAVTQPGFICEFKNRPIRSSSCESEHFCFLHTFIPHFSPALAVFLGGGKGSERPADWTKPGEYDRGVSRVAQNAGGTLVGCPSSPMGRGRWPCLVPTLRPFCFLPSGLSG